jgi:hypothetical protein
VQHQHVGENIQRSIRGVVIQIEPDGVEHRGEDEDRGDGRREEPENAGAKEAPHAEIRIQRTRQHKPADDKVCDHPP